MKMEEMVVMKTVLKDLEVELKTKGSKVFDSQHQLALPTTEVSSSEALNTFKTQNNVSYLLCLENKTQKSHLLSRFNRIILYESST